MKLQRVTYASVLLIVAVCASIKADDLDDAVNTANQDRSAAIAARKEATHAATLANSATTSANVAAANANLRASAAQTAAAVATSAQNALANGNPNFPIIYAGLRLSAINTSKAARIAANVAQNAADSATTASQTASDASSNATGAADTANDAAVKAEDSSNAIYKLIEDNPGNYIERVLPAELVASNGLGFAGTTRNAATAATNASLTANDAATYATNAAKSASDASAVAAAAASAGGQ